MCIEDIKIMGRSSGSMKRVAIAATAGAFLSPSLSRIAIIFCPDSAQNYWVSINSDVAVGEGICILANDRPFVLDVFTHGDFCRRPWFAISAAGAISAEVGELFLDTNLARESGYGEA